ncbi:MAG: hypothetical protein IPO27_02215 [Bacteroidetes bacterium]|nr:hypothetical protein [Bacteroidota bacterium]
MIKAPVIFIKMLRRQGITLWPFILIHARYKTDTILLNHERIHLRQQIELLVLPFYVLYLLHYLVNLLRYQNHQLAYENIFFEREAFENESNPQYLKHRKWFASFRFF